MRHAFWQVGLVVCGISISLYGQLNLMDGNFKIDTLAGYAADVQNFRMEADSSGNLYIDHYESGHADTGKIFRMDSSGNISLFAQNLSGCMDMCWTGGTAYGDYLYVKQSDKISRITSSGQVSTFVTASVNYAPDIGLDQTGNYDNAMYFGIRDGKYKKVSPDGTVTTFSNWPGYYVSGSTACGLDFDSSGRYGGYMFLGRNANTSSAQWAGGVFQVDTNGAVTKFTSALDYVMILDFASPFSAFNGDLFAEGYDVLNQNRGIWRIQPDGSASLFISTPISSGAQFCFGPDGNMYISQYDWTNHYVNISRVSAVPEPTTLGLFLLGGITALRKRKQT